MTMIRSELVARIAAQNPHLYEREVEALVSAVFDRITMALSDGDRVELRGFGAFEARERKPRTARNPRSGTAVEVEARTHVHFKPGKTILARLNRSEADPEQEAARLVRAS